MRILLVADGRSPTTRRWLDGLESMQHTVTLVSTFPCERPPAVAGFKIIPVAFGRLARPMESAAPAPGGPGLAGPRRLVGRFRSRFLSGRYFLGPFSLYASFDTTLFRQVVRSFRPDLIHALRIPFEGMLASFAPAGVRLAVSIWGNDLTLHAHGSRWMGALTRRTLRRAGGLLADTSRDLRLASSWGFTPGCPAQIVPGSGGLDLEEIARCKDIPIEPFAGGPLPAGAPLIINPRGLRPGSLRNDTFFKAIPQVLTQFPQAVFLCPSMAGQAEAMRWVNELAIEKQVRLLPALPQSQLWALFQQSQVFVSPSIHDGTPNSFLEASACGCFPVAGDIESFREWIAPGVNGLLVDSGDPQAMAEAILSALASPNLRRQAAEINAGLVRERAEAGRVRKKVQAFYETVCKME
jgi:glycosyltransferase involved in cell wall biosynthesis